MRPRIKHGHTSLCPASCHTHKLPRVRHSHTVATHNAHAPRARPPTHAPPSRLHPVFCGLVGSCIPGPISSLPAHQPVSRAEAAARLGASRGRPAAGLGSRGSPSWRGPHTRWRTHPPPHRLRGAAAPRTPCTHSLRPAALRIHRRLPETPPWPRPALQRLARLDSREGGWLTAGGGSWESLC